MPPHDPPINAERYAAVKSACEGWIKKLIDPSRRNNLLFFRPLRQGTLELTGAPPDAVSALLAPECESVAIDRLVAKDRVMEAAARLQEIRRRALANREERGLETLYLALGLATWAAADEGKPYASPVLLMPVEIEQRGSGGRSFALTRRGDVQANLVLTYQLEAQGAHVEPDRLVALVEGDNEGEPLNLDPPYRFLTERCRDLPGFSVDTRLVLGNFSFQKMAIVRDLRDELAQLAAHDVVAAIARDASARDAVRGSRTEIDPRELDRQHPDNEFLVLDADSTQQRAIGAALAGQNGVISGPPGTGKSQTIANLIAESAARGQKVLFVAEKRAALEAVSKRLEARGLGHLCLDLHGADVSRRQVMERVSQGLDRVREAPRVDPSAVHRRLVERRDRLNAHARSVHATREPTGLSVYALQGRLLRCPPDVQSNVRWRDKALASMTAAFADEVAGLLEEAGGFDALVLGTHPSPWALATIDSPKDAERFHDLAIDLATELRALRDRVATDMSAVRMNTPDDLTGLEALAQLLNDIGAVLERYRDDVFDRDLRELAAQLAPGDRTLTHLWALLTSPRYRAARRAALAARRNGNASASMLVSEIAAAERAHARWRTAGQPDARPVAFGGAAALRDDVGNFRRRVTELAAALPDPPLAAVAFDGMTTRIDGLAADSITPFQVSRVREIAKLLRDKGVAAMLDDVRRSGPAAATWPLRFRYAWLRSAWDAACLADPALKQFNGATHAKIVDEFTSLDRERLEVAGARVRRAHAERVIAVRNAHPDQDSLIKREAAKKRRHIPVRQLFQDAPDVLTALHPCWMASPLSVSQLLPGDKQYFDLVILDEASQVLPEDRVTSLLRGRKSVVAGDRRQLPPTTFFAAGTDEADEEDEATGGFESLLDVMSSIVDPPWGLDWHYRSRDEALIAFSNRYIYGDRLVTFPGAGAEPAVRHVLVGDQRPSLNEESGGAEVEEVVRLVLEHATSRPRETLGVIAMGIAHANRVEAAVETAVQERPELADFFDTSKPERFFVKNLERVQGDERDAIILTIGYGKDASGRLLYRFGPLLSDGGERRLNVAITRARSRMTVVSSFTHLDMDPSRSKAKGVELLRLYLEYASGGGSRLAASGSTALPLNGFEQAVYDALTARGIGLEPQWGSSKYRIDLVAKHPSRPGQFVLAIECDGASYHAAATARERDRLRQQHLEALGWRFHRIWSTDWFLDPEREIARTEKAFKDAASASDQTGAKAGDDSVRVDPPAAPAPVESRPPLPGRPSVPRHETIDEYSDEELDRVVRWVASLGNKTDDEIVEQVVPELGFGRRGRKIEAAIREAIERMRRKPSPGRL